jgi:hypothetical protein
MLTTLSHVEGQYPNSKLQISKQVLTWYEEFFSNLALA